MPFGPNTCYLATHIDHLYLSARNLKFHARQIRKVCIRTMSCELIACRQSRDRGSRDSPIYKHSPVDEIKSAN
jgi:hypothetical protein